MEILLRKYENKRYVWVEATWKNRTYIINDPIFGESEIEPIQILSVRNDTRSNLVECAYCGALIENNPEAIEKHYADEEAKMDCTKCKYMRIYGDRMNQQICL